MSETGDEVVSEEEQSNGAEDAEADAEAEDGDSDGDSDE